MGILVGALAKSGEVPVKLGQLLNICTTNALGRVMLGRRVFGDGSGRPDPAAVEFKSMVEEMMVLAGVFNFGDFIPVLDWFDLQGVAKKMKKLHARFDAFLSAILTERRNGSHGIHQGYSDFLNTLLDLKERDDADGDCLTDTEIKALLLVLPFFMIFLPFV